MSRCDIYHGLSISHRDILVNRLVNILLYITNLYNIFVDILLKLRDILPCTSQPERQADACCNIPPQDTYDIIGINKVSLTGDTSISNGRSGPMDKKEKKPGKLLIVLLLILFCLIGIFIGMILFRSYSRSQRYIVIPSGISFDADAGSEDHTSQSRPVSEEQGIAIHGREKMFIPAGKTEADTDFYNPEENSGLYYLTFELRLYDDSGKDYEVLYRSGLVAPGKHIYRISLSRSLEKGEYNGAVHVQPYRMDDEKTPTNNADMKIKIIAE